MGDTVKVNDLQVGDVFDSGGVTAKVLASPHPEYPEHAHVQTIESTNPEAIGFRWLMPLNHDVTPRVFHGQQAE